jgi:tetratricopeptide (TPR) repeat protein
MTTATLTMPRTAQPTAPAFSWREAAAALKKGSLSRYLAAVVGDEVEADPMVVGLEKFAAGNLAEALPKLELALAEQPFHQEAREAIAKCLRAAGRHAEALSHLEALLRTARKTAELTFLAGESALELGNRASAEKFFRQALVLDPKHTDAHIRLGIMLFDDKRHEESVAALNQAIFHDRKAAAARYYLAQNCAALGDVKRALSQLHMLVQLSPEYTPAYLCRADLFEHLGDQRQVIAELEKLVSLNYVNAEVMYRIARAHQALGQSDEAIAVYLGALQYDPQYAPALIAAARLAEEKHQLERARELYQRLTRDRRHHLNARAAVARVDAMLRDIQGAMAA